MKSPLRFLFALLTALLLLQTPLFAWAHGSIYFEFSPDAWASKRFVVTSAQSLAQVFQPASDITITAYDLWVDNTGEPGTATFTLVDEQGTTLATNSVTLQSLPAIPGGTKLHFNLSHDVLLNAGKKYSIKVDSSLFGFGIYYADRLLFLDHNQEFTTEYVNGVARIDQVDQPFTFKFALRSPAPSIGATTNEEVTDEVQAQQQISITGARVASVTATSVTLAWTTDIAADSRATIRNQISPLYVTTTGYDSTLELEHTLVINGLLPNVNYFADVFSSNGGPLTLTTYTIGFRTPAPVASPAPAPTQPVTPPISPTPTQPAVPPVTSVPPTQTTNTSNSANQGTTNTQSTNQNATGQSTTPGVRVGTGSSANTTSITWDVPKDAAVDGYRIDIFDTQHNLEKQILVPAGTNTKDVPELAKGLHHAIVYAETGGVFKKVAPTISFLLQSKDKTMIWKILGLVVLWIVGLGGYFRWKFKKEKTVLTPEEGYDPNR